MKEADLNEINCMISTLTFCKRQMYRDSKKMNSCQKTGRKEEWIGGTKAFQSSEIIAWYFYCENFLLCVSINRHSILNSVNPIETVALVIMTCSYGVICCNQCSLWWEMLAWRGYAWWVQWGYWGSLDLPFNLVVNVKPL